MARSFLLIALLEEAYDLEELAIKRLSRIRRPLNINEKDCLNIYRLSEPLILALEEELIPYIPKLKRQGGLPVRTKILCTLSFLASGDHQKIIGGDKKNAVSQPSMSRAIRQVLDAMCHPDLVQQYIKSPQNSSDRRKLKDRFLEKFGIPNVIGCIDSTLIDIVRPKDNEKQYFIKDKQHAVSVQLICDADLNIIQVNSSFGGAMDDSTIFNKSSIKTHLENLHKAGETVYLLGDSDYPQEPYLMTPILNAQSDTPEANYNKIHAIAHSTAFTLIRTLKTRFRCLLGQKILHYHPDMVTKIVIACCVLHNICNEAGLPVPTVSEKVFRGKNKGLLKGNGMDAGEDSICLNRSYLVDIMSQASCNGL